ncbi:g10028 [Coccomyxa viridis]|uniref:Hexosyltransferase n=1 Tax=Coccomyxa viridis TaxID=1274662 RepID=A0ABP1G4R4_9CHLO
MAAHPEGGKHRVKALMAVLTGFGPKYADRRKHARETWFPNSQAELDKLEEEKGIRIRFTTGLVPDEYKDEIAEEESKYGEFLRIPIKDEYHALSYKTMALWRLVEDHFDIDYLIKVDDDNFVRLDRLSIATHQWDEENAEYIGCFKIRNVADARSTMRTERWYDPHHMVFVGDDSRYAEGPFYALRAPIISGILRSGLSPRLGGPEDSMVGAMMKAFNVTFYDDRRLCHMEGCTDTMIAFKWDHAVRDFMDPDKRFPTLCCLPKEKSQQDPPVDECTDTSKYHEEGIRCLHYLTRDSTCATETIVDGKWLGKYTYYNYTVDHEWINQRAPDETSWRYGGYGHNHQGRL